MLKSKRSFLLWAFLVLAGFIFAYLPVLLGLISTWSSSEDYSHGFFIIPISIYLIWRKSELLSKLPVNGSNWGLAIVIFSLLIYLFSVFAEIKTLATLSIIPFVAGAVIYLFGFRIFKELVFPISFLVFMIPIPSQIYSALTIPLQLLVSKVAVWLASLSEVPVYREGNVIHLSDRTLQVVRACSGMRSIMSLLTLSAVLGYMTLRSNFLRTLLFLSGVPVAIMVNIARVLLMLLAFHYLHIDLTTGHYHTLLGMLVFGLALILLMLIKKFLSLWDVSPVQD